MARTSSVRVKINGRGIRELLKSGEISAELESRMQRALAAARAGAPVDTGEYRDSLKLEVDQHPQRVAVHLISTAPHGFLVEAATGNLARALDAAGGRQ